MTFRENNNFEQRTEKKLEEILTHTQKLFDDHQYEPKRWFRTWGNKLDNWIDENPFFAVLFFICKYLTPAAAVIALIVCLIAAINNWHALSSREDQFTETTTNEEFCTNTCTALDATYVAYNGSWTYPRYCTNSANVPENPQYTCLCATHDHTLIVVEPRTGRSWIPTSNVAPTTP